MAEETPEDEPEFQEENFEGFVEEVRDHSDLQEPDLLKLSLIGFKNPTSYLIGTTTTGIKLIENKIQTYAADHLPGDPNQFCGIIYISHLNCYLLVFEARIYRKDINENPAYVFMDLNCGSRIGALKYLALNKRLIFPKDGKNLAVLNLDTKQVEIEIEVEVNWIRGFIQSLAIFPNNENKIAFLTSEGWLYFYWISYELRRVCAKHRHQVFFNRGLSLAVCNEGKYVLVALCNPHTSLLSQINLYSVNDRTFKHSAYLDQMDQSILVSDAFSYYGRIGNHIIWVSLCFGHVSFYCFNTKTGEREDLRELKEKRVYHTESYPRQIYRFGDMFYFFGDREKLIRLFFSYFSS